MKRIRERESGGCLLEVLIKETRKRDPDQKSGRVVNKIDFIEKEVGEQQHEQHKIMGRREGILSRLGGESRIMARGPVFVHCVEQTWKSIMSWGGGGGGDEGSRCTFQ